MKIKKIISIYNELRPGNNDFDSNANYDSTEFYAISRTFISSFRKYVEQKVKSIIGEPTKKFSDKIAYPFFGEIDHLDFDELKQRRKGEKYTLKQNSPSSESESLDVQVNTNITCKLRYGLNIILIHFPIEP